jgi:hypothetical protein
MKNLEQLELESIAETKELEEKAFELFIKAYIKQDLEHIEKAKINLESLVKQKESQDIDFYVKEFNSMDMRSGSCSTYKENYIAKVK